MSFSRPTVSQLARYAEEVLRPPGDPILHCPPEIAQDLAANLLQVDHTTLRDGNCCPHAFIIGLKELARFHPCIARSASFKKLVQHKTAAAAVAHLRLVAASEMHKRRDEEMWEGMTYQQLAVAMTSTNSYGDYIRDVVNNNGQWLDAFFLHVVAVHYKLDVAIWQRHGLSLVGLSLVGGHQDPPLMSIAMENDRHFWGVIALELSVVPYVDKGDLVPACPAESALPTKARTRAVTHLVSAWTPQRESCFHGC